LAADSSSEGSLQDNGTTALKSWREACQQRKGGREGGREGGDGKERGEKKKNNL
jgi:hypothetical protein